jgi:hypothetical protein
MLRTAQYTAICMTYMYTMHYTGCVRQVELRITLPAVLSSTSVAGALCHWARFSPAAPAAMHHVDPTEAAAGPHRQAVFADVINTVDRLLLVPPEGEWPAE